MMLISTLLAPWVQIPTEYDSNIANLSIDSRKIEQNDAFIALQGQQTAGEQYIQDAILKGACLILLDGQNKHRAPFVQSQVLHVPIQGLAALLPELAERFYQLTDSDIQLIGVTGTNGKTSCTHFLADVYAQMGVSCGIIGTLGNGFYGQLTAGTHTTPDIITLYRTIKQLQQQGARKIAMEVSSHSIAQKRIAGLHFALGVFTNLTQDHLDYHGTMEAYAAVKYQFLQDALTKRLVVNEQDAYGKRWLPQLAKTHDVLTFGMEFPENTSHAVYASNVTYLPHGVEATIHAGDEQGILSLPLLGEFNLSNALAVLATLIALEDASLHELLPYFKQLKSVPGRMQLMGGGSQPLVVIDYAHTPDALEKTLFSLRRHTHRRLICVFGCGGDRDRSKRPRMGSIAANLADHVILTNDNPRSEDPRVIIEEIMGGISNHSLVTILPDRSKAIENSIQYARSGDVILIAGKGAERFQYIGAEVIPFLDEEEVRRQLKA